MAACSSVQFYKTKAPSSNLCAVSVFFFYNFIKIIDVKYKTNNWSSKCWPVMVVQWLRHRTNPASRKTFEPTCTTTCVPNAVGHWVRIRTAPAKWGKLPWKLRLQDNICWVFCFFFTHFFFSVCCNIWMIWIECYSPYTVQQCYILRQEELRRNRE